MAENVRVLIVDDHDIVREGQRALINTEPGMEVIGEAKNGIEAIELADKLQPDVILMDLHMPKKDGIEASEEIKKRNPEARILVLTSFAEDERVYAAIKAGAMGYLLKDSSPQKTWFLIFLYFPHISSRESQKYYFLLLNFALDLHQTNSLYLL